MALKAIRAGLVRSAREAALALPLYLTALLLGALPAAVVGIGFVSVARGRPWDWLSDDGWANQAAELVVAAESLMHLGGEPSGRVGMALGAALLAVLATGVAFVGQVLAYAFLSGGILARLRDREAAFWPACRRWFGPLFRLGVVEFVLLALVGLPGALLLGSLGSPLGRTAELVLAVGWLSLIGGWLELARAWMVTREEPEAMQAVGIALRAARSLSVPGVWVLLGAVSSSLVVLQGFALALDEPITSFGTVQVLLFVGAWLKVLRLATMLALCEALKPAAGS